MKAVEKTKGFDSNCLLLACAGSRNNAALREAAHYLSQNESDWDEVVAGAERHGLGPILYRRLSQERLLDCIPPEITMKLKMDFMRTAALAVRFSVELERLIARLNLNGIEPVILKGAALAETIYEDPALRPYSDIDLLIKEEDWPLFRSALRELGFEPQGRDCPTLPYRLTTSDMHDHWFSFRDSKGPMIECKFDPLELGLRMKTLDTVWERTVEFNVGLSRARKLSINDELVMLCVHLNRHGYRRLIWLVDIVKFVDANKDVIDWDRVYKTARAEKVLPSVFYTLKYVNELLGGDVPNDVLWSLRPSRIKSLVWQVFWPRPKVISFTGPHEAALVFRKRFSSIWLVPNLILTGRPAEKLGYFVRKLVPTPEFLRERYGGNARRDSYFRLLFRRYLAFIMQKTRPGNISNSSRTKRESDIVNHVSVVNPIGNAPVKLSIVIVTYDHPRLSILFSCLEALCSQSCADFEVILVCNGPVPNVSNAAVKRYLFPIKLVELRQNYGPGVGRNSGADIAAADIVCFLDDDAIPHQDFVRSHLEAYEKEDVLAVRGKVVPLNQRNFINNIAGVHDLGDQEKPSLLSIEGNMSIDKALFQSVSGFDYSLYGHEGIDLTYRLVKNGISREKIIYNPAAIIRHEFATSIFGLGKISFWYGRNLRKIEVIHPGISEFIDSYTSHKKLICLYKRESVLHRRGLMARGRDFMLGRYMSSLGTFGWLYGYATVPFITTQKTKVKENDNQESLRERAEFFE